MAKGISRVVVIAVLLASAVPAWAQYTAGATPVQVRSQCLSQAEIDRIAALVDLNGTARIDPSQVDLEIQRDATMDSWRKRFLRDHGDPNHVDPI